MAKPDNDSDEAPRRGSARIPSGELRKHSVTVRLNLDEVERLDGSRALVQMNLAQYVRSASLNRLPPTIPALNIEVWTRLAPLADALMDLARNRSEGDALEFDPVALPIDLFLRNLRAFNLKLIDVTEAKN